MELNIFSSQCAVEKPHKEADCSEKIKHPCRNESSESDSSKAPKVCASTTRDPSVYEENEETNKLSTDPSKSHISALNINSVVTTNTLAPDHQPTVDPISALQTVMNLHLGGATKPALSVTNPMDMLFKMSNSMAKKVLLKAVPPETDKKMESANGGVNDLSKDQPIDLSKGQSKTPASSTRIPASQPTSISPYQENALADISDMLRNLTEPNVLSKVSKRGSWLKQSTSERASIADETEEEDFTSQKHKGHQSNWNPIHLLILQACFTASLRRTADGKYVSTDLSPKERTQISNLTGLSMATISHWLANVKYQLRRSGRTKFLRNLDVGQPVFFCSQCSSQVRSPSAHVYHLESHLGFRMKDFPKLSADKLRKFMEQAQRSAHYICVRWRRGHDIEDTL
uniref:C2H2-type domain-containing protein n=1 Tax=Denticeps clupeoides TaxID=299321 RepID=A0AAY4BTE0_9TELE